MSTRWSAPAHTPRRARWCKPASTPLKSVRTSWKIGFDPTLHRSMTEWPPIPMAEYRPNRSFPIFVIDMEPHRRTVREGASGRLLAGGTGRIFGSLAIGSPSEQAPQRPCAISPAFRRRSQWESRLPGGLRPERLADGAGAIAFGGLADCLGSGAGEGAGATGTARTAGVGRIGSTVAASAAQAAASSADNPRGACLIARSGVRRSPWAGAAARCRARSSSRQSRVRRRHCPRRCRTGWGP